MFCVLTVLILNGLCQLQDDLSICYYSNKIVAITPPWAKKKGNSFIETGASKAAPCAEAQNAPQCARTGVTKRWERPEVKEGDIPNNGPKEKVVKDWLDKNPGYSYTNSACAWCERPSDGMCLDCNAQIIAMLETQGYACAPHCTTDLKSPLPPWKPNKAPPPVYLNLQDPAHTWGTTQWCDALVAHVAEEDPEGTLFLKSEKEPVLDAPVDTFVKMCNEMFDVPRPTWAESDTDEKGFDRYKDQVKSGTNLLFKHSKNLENGNTHQLLNLAVAAPAQFPYHVCGDQCRRVSKLYDQVARMGTEVQTGKAQAANPWNLRRSPLSNHRYTGYSGKDQRLQLDPDAGTLSNDQLGAGMDITHPVSAKNVKSRRAVYVLQVEDCVKCIDEDACYPQCFARGDCPFLLRHLTPDEQDSNDNDKANPQLPLLP